VRWIHAHDLRIGDLVLFADGSLHKINNIDIKVDIKTVYNFTVSNNHNYYVGKNKVLVHNRGGRRGGGSSSRPTTTKRSKTVGERVDSSERYHVIEKTLSSLNDKYSDISAAKDRAFGTKHLKNLDAEIKLLEKQRDATKSYRDEVEKYLKIDTSNLTKTIKEIKQSGSEEEKENRKNAKYTKITGSKFKYNKKTKKASYKTTESHAEADASIKGFLGMDAIIDENGTITNIEDIKKAADKKKNDMADRYAKEHKDDKALEKKEKESTKKWKKRIKDNLALESEKAMVDA